MNTQTAARFEALCAAARNAVFYDPTEPRLTIVNDEYVGAEAIKKALSSKEWDLTPEQIEDASEMDWQNSVWWYALHLEATQIVEAHHTPE